jgi:protein-S-isoprenylcysteine O-methyltransferase Ste14
MRGAFRVHHRDKIADPSLSRRCTTTKTVVLSLVSGAGFLVVYGALLFGCAGRWDLPMFWAYLGVWAGTLLVAVPAVDPTLIQERIRPGPGGKDYVTAIVLTPLWLGQSVVAALDVGRHHWSDTVPVAVQLLALLVMAAGAAVTVWAEVVNRFFSPVIRIQTERGHHVITTGPYRYLRHPGYAAGTLLFFSGAVVLGSWLGILIGLSMIPPILVRTIREDRILREQLEGYAAYAEKVRYRLLPGVW